MKTTAREIRIIAKTLQSTPAFPATDRECRRHDNIIECARIAMAENGFANITMGAFAIGMRIAVATMRRHFCDLGPQTRLATSPRPAGPPQQHLRPQRAAALGPQNTRADTKYGTENRIPSFSSRR
jgi:hypothetical protein